MIRNAVVNSWRPAWIETGKLQLWTALGRLASRREPTPSGTVGQRDVRISWCSRRKRAGYLCAAPLTRYGPCVSRLIESRPSPTRRRPGGIPRRREFFGPTTNPGKDCTAAHGNGPGSCRARTMSTNPTLLANLAKPRRDGLCSWTGGRGRAFMWLRFDPGAIPLRLRAAGPFIGDHCCQGSGRRPSLFGRPPARSEVLLRFVEGNPDRRLGSGSVFKQDSMPLWRRHAQNALKGRRSRGLNGVTANTLGRDINGTVLDDTVSRSSSLNSGR